MNVPAQKPHREDWRWFNQAVERQAAYLVGLPPGPVRPRPSPAKPVDWLRRGLGVGAVIVAGGFATFLVLWVLRSPLAIAMPRGPVNPPIGPATPSQPSNPIVVNYTLFTKEHVPALGIEVVSGWVYPDSTQQRPSRQFCYIDLPNPTGGAPYSITIATDAIGILPYHPQRMAPLDLARYEAALPKCRWAQGTVLPESPTSRSRHTSPESHQGRPGSI
jgi:hypothetical protein